jgi:hypothetical protein
MRRMAGFTRADFEADRARYATELARLLELGLSDGHPLVERERRRIETVDRVLTDPAYGLVDESEGTSL